MKNQKMKIETSHLEGDYRLRKILRINLKTKSYTYYVDYARNLVYIENNKFGYEIFHTVWVEGFILRHMRLKKTIQSVDVYDESFLEDLETYSYLYGYDVIQDIKRLFELVGY